MNDDQLYHALLVDNNWHSFEDNIKSENYKYIGSFQYWEEDKKGKKFFITAHTLDLTEFTESPWDTSVSFSSQFTIDDKVINLKLLSAQVDSLDEVVEFFKEAWENLNCDYDEKY